MYQQRLALAQFYGGAKRKEADKEVDQLSNRP